MVVDLWQAKILRKVKQKIPRFVGEVTPECEECDESGRERQGKLIDEELNQKEQQDREKRHARICAEKLFALFSDIGAGGFRKRLFTVFDRRTHIEGEPQVWARPIGALRVKIRTVPSKVGRYRPRRISAQPNRWRFCHFVARRRCGKRVDGRPLGETLRSSVRFFRNALVYLPLCSAAET